MKRIVVTGGAGRLGRRVIDDLVARGYDVLAVDVNRPAQLRCRFLPADLTDLGVAHEVVRNADGVIHLAAVPGPTSQPPSVTFRTNVLSTNNVAEAAAACGVKRLVFASSVFALGWHESPQVYWPRTVPVDEDHPLTPFEPYGLSKQLGESIIASVCRRSGMSAVSLRLMNIIQDDGYFALPWPVPTAERPVRFVMWPYVDARDAATSCRLALEARVTGHEAVSIAAADTRFDVPTEALLRQFAPQVEIEGSLPGNATVISLQKAEQLLGYRPQYSWRTQQK